MNNNNVVETDTDTKCSDYASWLKKAKSPELLACNEFIFATSLDNKNDIQALPVENIVWNIEEIKLEQCLGLQIKRLIVVSEISPQTTPEVLQASIALKSSLSLDVQAISLFCHACLHPSKKKPRRPYNLLLKDNLNVNAVVKEISSFGVHVIDTQGFSSEDISQRVDQKEMYTFYKCFGCGLMATQDMFYVCPECNAVRFCGKVCEKKNKQHKYECKLFEDCMNKEIALGELCFEFSKECTLRDFTTNKLQQFLQAHDVAKKGLWRRECWPELFSSIPFGGLPCDDKPFALPLEGAVLENSTNQDLNLVKPLKDWADYYNLRGFWLDSPVAVVLHYPLTLYWVITTCLPKHYPQIFENIRRTNFIEVHIIGAEKEVEMFYPFLELARLLHPIEVRLNLFGDKLSFGFAHKRENLTFVSYPGLYHLERTSLSSSPHLAIGYNAGLSAYPSFKETIQVLQQKLVPLYCTDYCYLSVDHSNKALFQSKMGYLEDVQINPFRCPFRMFTSDMSLPRYSNAFIFHIIPFSK